MQNINKTIELITNGTPISKALAQVYKTRNVQIPYNEKNLYVQVTELEMSKRATNCLLKEQLDTVADVVNFMNNHHWSKIKGCGKTVATEIFEKILDVSWGKLNTKQRAEFLLRVDAENEAIL